MKKNHVISLFFMFIFILPLVLITACGKGKEEVPESISDTVETSVTTVSGALDDVSSESITLRSADPLQAALSCSRSFSCDSGVWTRSADCEVGNYSWIGSVTAHFFDNTGATKTTCSIATSGDYFERSGEVTVSGPRGSLELTSSNRTAYDGTVVGGGTKVARTGVSSFTLEITGGSKVLSNSEGVTLFDISVTTGSALSVTGNTRASRTVDGGSIIVRHNLAQYTATHVPKMLKWESGCCYPVSGSIESTFTGSITGDSETKFEGCKEGTIVKNEASRRFTLSYCEN